MEILTATITTPGSEGRGTEIGSRFSAEIRDTVNRYLEFFEVRGRSESEVREIAESCVLALESWSPGLAAELRATAAAAGVELWKLAALNARTEVLATVEPDTEGECSTFVHAPPGTDAPRTIQTWDWHAHLCPSGLILSYEPDSAASTARGVGRVVTFTECGMLAKIGVNDAGIGVHFNILHHVADRGTGGVPVHAIARRVLEEATTLGEAEEVIRSARASASTVLTVVSANEADHRAACFEISADHVATVTPDSDGILLHTNHFLAPTQQAGEATRDASTTFIRLAHVEAWRSEIADSMSLDTRAAAMCGDAGGQAPVCFRPDPNEPLHEQWTTLLTIGLDVVNGALEYYPGSPARLAEEGVLRSS